ncbi:ImmA/IrrE family metallo-endopeptidase [Thermodesulfovibrio thiophilus]|uniref:ImmA/IrrE family metallo-endopeptidase n=1 Tax=Thermodesulfovibrio thiophilus TaxID=340095 RepID=UPI000418967B|nr:ImmA/IrrE family metallo-endopeptidase [Thermodesulfovibrio thiophilus]
MAGTVKLPDAESVKTVARKLLKDLGINEPPVDLIQVARHLNAEIVLSDELPEEVHGTVVPVKSGSFLILVNVFICEARRNFTIAHELAHIALRHHRIAKVLTSTANISPSKDVEKKIERLADAFASELLMPKHWVRKYVNAYGTDVKELAEIFMVSHEAMRIRLKELKLIP